MPIYHQEPENDSPSLIKRRSYQAYSCALLHFGPIALYCDSDVLEEGVRELSSEGFEVVSFESATWKSGYEAHVDLAQKLDFPAYYGCSLDALSDCLGEVRISDDAGLALVLRDYDDFARRDRALARGFLDVFASESRLLQIFGKTLVALVHSKDPDIQFGPLGAVSGWWNSREFVRSKRGSAS
jgi:RNAse (barnase) inhibitor barstar